MFHLLKSYSMRSQWQADHECGEEVLEVLGQVSISEFVDGRHESGRVQAKKLNGKIEMEAHVNLLIECESKDCSSHQGKGGIDCKAKRIRTLVYGRSSSVMRRSLDDV